MAGTIAPARLLGTLKVLLSPSGGIKSHQEVRLFVFALWNVVFTICFQHSWHHTFDFWAWFWPKFHFRLDALFLWCKSFQGNSCPRWFTFTFWGHQPPSSWKYSLLKVAGISCPLGKNRNLANFLINFLYTNCRLSRAVCSTNWPLCSELLYLLTLCPPPPHPTRPAVQDLLLTIQLQNHQSGHLSTLALQVRKTFCQQLSKCDYF